MGYSENEGMVRVDRFKDSGKWYDTFSIDMNLYYNDDNIYNALEKAIQDRFIKLNLKIPDEGYIVCLEPYHKWAFPIMIKLSKIQK